MRPTWARSRVAAVLAAFGLAAALAALAGVGADKPPEGAPTARGERIAGEFPPSLTVYDTTAGLGAGWRDLGWAQRTLLPGKPALLDFSRSAGWILAHDEVPAAGGLVIELRAPPAFGDFLEVRLESRRGRTFPRVRIDPAHRADLDDGGTQVALTQAELNPQAQPFDQVVLQAVRPASGERVEISRIYFSAAPALLKEAVAARPPRSARLTLDCRRSRSINPLIYGVSFGDNPEQTFASARRWGGNTTSRYNWKLGHAWNTGKDWFFKNVDITAGHGAIAWERFLDDSRANKMASVFTVPMTGWVAKDTVSCGFPVSEYGAQKAAAPDNPDCGNGEAPDGRLIVPGAGSVTGIPAPPEFVEAWVRKIREKDQPGPRTVKQYVLDNEPTLWHLNHRDIHPEPVSYDELLARTLSYGAAVKRGDPDAQVAGFVSWGWSALFYSAADNANGQGFIAKDRLLHGGRPLLPWWLASLREHEKRTGQRVVDVVDVHFYPQAPGIGLYADGWTDPATNAKRIRSSRALWDPSYLDESWINEPVKLIPRIKAWIDENAPGLGVSIGEYNFGAEAHMSSGLATAEALGHFGQLGVTSAFYWAMPPKDSPPAVAFRAFRNYDGKGARFLDESIDVTDDDPGLSSFFASTDKSGRLVVVALNEDPEVPLALTIDGGTCGALSPVRVFRATSGAGLKAVAKEGAAPVLPPYSINVLELRRTPAAK